MKNHGFEKGDKVRAKIGGHYQDMYVVTPRPKQKYLETFVGCAYTASDGTQKPQQFDHYANPKNLTKI